MNENTRDLIKNRMRELGLSQVDLANRLSMTSSQISRIISGDRGTTLENLVSIADVLHIERTYLLKVASGQKPEANNDEWVEEQSQKLKLIPPSLQSIAGKFIDSVVTDEERSKKPKDRKARSSKGL